MALKTTELWKLIVPPLRQRSEEALAAYKAGQLTREEWHRADPHADLTEQYDGTNKDPEYKAIKKKLDGERRDNADRGQLAGMWFDSLRERGWQWKGHRLYKAHLVRCALHTVEGRGQRGRMRRIALVAGMPPTVVTACLNRLLALGVVARNGKDWVLVKQFTETASAKED